MRRQQFTNGQVVFWSLVFVLLMGLAGKIDRDSRQAYWDERVYIRDEVKKARVTDDAASLAFYTERSRK